jgi:TonB family protein
VGNRLVVYLAKPAYADPNSEGTVYVSIQVSASGAVIKTDITRSTTSSAALKNAALAAAKQSRFSEGDRTESGTITYRFKLR